MNPKNGQADPEPGPGKAMSSPAAVRVYGQHSGYRNLKAYQVAELLYDFTCRFCNRYVPKSDRHHDQVVQAARSGYQNIAEGSEDSATSKKLEMNLTNVARSSIDEARKDYLKHLTRHGLRQWQEGDPVFTEARKLHPTTLDQAAAWVNKRGTAEPRLHFYYHANDHPSIVSKVWIYAHVLKNVGLGYGDYLEQITYIHRAEVDSLKSS